MQIGGIDHTAPAEWHLCAAAAAVAEELADKSPAEPADKVVGAVGKTAGKTAEQLAAPAAERLGEGTVESLGGGTVGSLGEGPVDEAARTPTGSPGGLEEGSAARPVVEVVEAPAEEALAGAARGNIEVDVAAAKGGEQVRASEGAKARMKLDGEGEGEGGEEFRLEQKLAGQKQRNLQS